MEQSFARELQADIEACATGVPAAYPMRATFGGRVARRETRRRSRLDRTDDDEIESLWSDME